MVRFYIVRRVGQGTAQDPWRAKYFSPPAGAEAELFPKGSWAHSVPGRSAMMVEADTTTQQHNALTSQPDVVVIQGDALDLTTPQRDEIGLVLPEAVQIPRARGYDASGVVGRSIRAAQIAYGRARRRG